MNKQQTRKTVLRRIRSYLRKHPEELKGVRNIQKNRLDGLIKRLDEFSPIETLRWNVPDRKLFRDIALAAGIQFVREYPMLYHTPNSLRACFGMPTRTDRKKGRFSSIFYRNEAVERQLRPRIEDIENLQSQVNQKRDGQFSNEIEILNRYIKRAINRRYVDDILEIPESDHSEKSISNLRRFLEKHGFEDLKEATDVSEEHLQDLDGIILAPDMISQWKGRECWIELKEYHELKFNFKVVFQVFRYLYQNPFVLLISTSPLPSFTQLLDQKIWTTKTLQEWALQKQDELQDRISGWNEIRSTYVALGRKLKLNPRFETLFLVLTNEIVINEIGLAGTELKGIEKFLDLVSHFKGEITICSFDEFVENDQIPTNYCLLMKMDFPFEFKYDSSDKN
ncbi:MAG: hypothetical protein JSW11_08535 [Candidatus Heimdallarchaeota archaeon]|nr:MAG: hypothetical protein JSW11_08535 [Candidatus Heimdallarchaeota archaeon]